MISSSRFTLSIALLILCFGLFAVVASANHSWGGYHWARTANPFTLKIGDNVSANWDSYLGTAASDWSLSNVLDMTVVFGGTSPKNCKAVLGRVEVCNSKYGKNGWLGIASVWTSGTHIMQGVVKVNDTYFSTQKYNIPAWKNLVMCQEIGHTVGLDHQDENFDNQPLGTCMDYTNDPTQNQHPNQHDYDMLNTIYAHLDTSTTVGQTTLAGNQNLDIDHSNPTTWGKKLRESSDKRASLYERDFGSGKKIFTFIIWADK